MSCGYSTKTIKVCGDADILAACCGKNKVKHEHKALNLLMIQPLPAASD